MREIVFGNIEQQQVGIDSSGRVDQHEQMRHIEVGHKRSYFLRGIGNTRFERLVSAPQTHTPYIIPGSSGYDFSPLRHTFEHIRCQRTYIFRRIGIEQSLQARFEMLYIPVIDISQCVDKHEFGNEFRQRISSAGIFVKRMYSYIITCQISIVSRDIQRILHQVHASEIFEVIRVGQRYGIFAIGEIFQNSLFIFFGHRLVSYTHTDKITVIIGFETVIVLGKTTVEFIEIGHRRLHIFEAVFEYHRHIE